MVISNNKALQIGPSNESRILSAAAHTHAHIILSSEVTHRSSRKPQAAEGRQTRSTHGLFSLGSRQKEPCSAGVWSQLFVLVLFKKGKND